MSTTYTGIYIHVVFAVKNRSQLITGPREVELQNCIAGIVRSKGQRVLAMGGMPDHIHLLLDIKPSVTVSSLVGRIKAGSSRFINRRSWFDETFRWQTGFGAFSCSMMQLERTIHYIENQEIHHARKSFREEYREFARKFDISFNERYIS